MEFHRFDAPGLRVFLDEVAAYECPLQPREEFDGSGRVAREAAIEAAFGRGSSGGLIRNLLGHTT